jgi:spermidine synthase
MDGMRPSKPSPATTTVLLGVSTVIAQSVLLREAMAAMGGSEMAWGAVMALWLVGVGAGARIGVRIGTPAVAAWLPAAAVTLAAAGVLLFRAAPALLDTDPGETLTTSHAIWLWAMAVIPCAATAGLAFPILAGELGERGPGRAYALEAAGALAGGLAFSFILATLGAAPTLLLALGALSAPLLGRRHIALAIVGLVVAALASVPAERELAAAGWRWSGRPGELASRADTRGQRLEASAGPPISLYVNGRLAASYPDPYTTSPRAHLTLLLHPGPTRVFAAGASADGTIETIAGYPLEELFVVEDDPQLLPLLERWYGREFRESLRQPSVRFPKGDPLRALSGVDNLDLILLDDGDPTTLRANRTRTIEFFRRCRSALEPAGVIVVETGVSDTYLGGEAGRLIATLHATLADVFPQVTAIPGERVLLVAGRRDAELTIDAAALEHRWLSRSELPNAMPPGMIRLLVDPARQAALQQWLRSADAPVNSIARPGAVAHAAALHEARSRASLARLVADPDGVGRRALTRIGAAAAAALLLTAFVRRRRVRAVAVAMVVGSTSMGWWLLLLAAWQATRGSVFAEIGALTGLFMAGVAVGGWIGLHLEPVRASLAGIVGCGVVVSVLLASGASLYAPAIVIPFMLVTGGGLTGAAFPILGRAAGAGDARRGAGVAFAGDEIGAALAALSIGTVAVPWLGMTGTALGLTALGLAALPATMRD